MSQILNSEATLILETTRLCCLLLGDRVDRDALDKAVILKSSSATLGLFVTTDCLHYHPAPIIRHLYLF